MGNQTIFDDFISREDKLTTAGGSMKISGRGNATISLPNGSTAKLDGVLMVPGIGTNLLSTQALLAQGIETHQLVRGVDFYREGERDIAAKGTHEGKTSYLTWVRDEDALFNETARRVSEEKTSKKTRTKAVKKAGKRMKDQKKSKKVADAETAHQQFSHLGEQRLT